MLGVAFEEIDLRDAKGEVQLHPCVALHDCGPLNADRFRINLGAEPFKFDIFPYLLQKTVLGTVSKHFNYLVQVTPPRR